MYRPPKSGDLSFLSDSSGLRPGKIKIISEPGLYKLTFKSRKPEAKRFTRWVTSEVVPAIRKHGGYLTPAAIEKALFDPDFLIGLG